MNSHSRAIRVGAALTVIALLAMALWVIWRVYKKYSDVSWGNCTRLIPLSIDDSCRG